MLKDSNHQKMFLDIRYGQLYRSATAKSSTIHRISTEKGNLRINAEVKAFTKEEEISRSDSCNWNLTWFSWDP